MFGAYQIGCQRPSRFWGLGCPKIYHEVEDTLARSYRLITVHPHRVGNLDFSYLFAFVNCWGFLR
ncbi:hypothetical protein [Thiolapillus sp.]|uniref:hypothetical protein n=1 Tax=Thiolapillus sp. TaxID=2017437 RepID=UPI003AF683F1